MVEAACPDHKFVQAELMVHESLQLFRTPMFERFMRRIKTKDSAPNFCKLTLLDQASMQQGESYSEFHI